MAEADRTHHRVWGMQRRKTMCVFYTLAEGLPGKNRADAVRGRIQRRNGVRGALVFITEFRASWFARASSRKVDTAEGVPSRGYVIPLRGWHECGSGHAGLLRKRRRKTAEPERSAKSKGFVQNESTVARPAA